MSKSNPEKKISKSVRLRKYGSVYNAYMRKNTDRNKYSERHRSTRHKTHKTERDSSKKKSLNEYQKFVKKESKKEKYSNMRGSDRLAVIAQEWDRKKRQDKRQKN